jgi:hypothetical protein
MNAHVNLGLMTLRAHRILSTAFGVAVTAMTCLAQSPTTQPNAATQDLQPIEVNLKDMSLFDLDQVNGTASDVPKSFRDLDGKRVTFVGEMWDPKLGGDGKSVSFFQTVYSKSHWSFRGSPHAQDFWACTPSAGISVTDTDAPIRVTGVLHVKIQKDSGVIKSVYEVDVESVQPFNGDFPPPPHDTTRPDF